MTIAYREAELIKDAAKFSRMYGAYIKELSSYSERLNQMTKAEIDRDAINYFDSKDYIPFLITENEIVIGFFVIGNNQNKHPDTDAFMGEFYIDVCYRGKGIGKKIGREILKQYGPTWSLFILKYNYGAYTFWCKVIDGIGTFVKLSEVGATPDDCEQYGVKIKE